MNDSSALWNYNNTVPKVDLTNPDEMIRANGAAEAAQTDRLKAEVEDYTQVLGELRQLYEKNNELVQKLQFMNRNTTEDIRTMIEDNNRQISDKITALEEWDHNAFRDEMKASITDAREQIIGSIRESNGAAADLFQESNEFNHKDNVRVYRNVQASVIAELSKQTMELNEKLDTIVKQSEPDQAQTFRQKVTLGLLIAVIVVQVLEGAGLMAVLMGLVH